MASDRAQHDRVKNWAGRNNADEDCVHRFKYTEAVVKIERSVSRDRRTADAVQRPLLRLQVGGNVSILRK